MTIAIRPEILALRDTLVETRRDLHRHPEIGFEEVRTSGIVEARLRELGFEVKRVAKTGVVGTIAGDSGADGPTLACRADMDALPLQELKDSPYKSTNAGRMHACGHDGHTSILLGFARYLASRRASLPGRVKLLFQPAEEGPGGAKPMIDEGALDEPRVDAVVGLHLWNEFPVGTLGTHAGPVLASADEFVFTVVGRGGHGALPHQTVDAVVVAAHVVTALQTLVARNVDPTQPAVVTIGQINGGSNFNIIAQEVELRGTVRTLDPTLRGEMKGRIEALAGGVCRAMGATYRYEWTDHYPVTVNDAAMSALVQECAADLLGADRIITQGVTMGAEDMSYFLQARPGCFFFLGSANPAKGLDKPHHHPEFDFDEDALPLGVEMFARVADRYFSR
ncbi:MAG: amidohydrolase [Deltaproteobacteria bacterium]|nr:amidohydrolase [Deltaproteobacteria bacterium]